MTQVKAVAQWDIDEITIDIQGATVILFEDPNKSGFVHGVVKKAQVCLTKDEAKSLMSDLALAIAYYEYMEKCVEDDFETR